VNTPTHYKQIYTTFITAKKYPISIYHAPVSRVCIVKFTKTKW